MSKHTDRKIAHTFRLRPETLEQLKAAAAADVRSMNSAVELACRRWLADRGQTPPPQKTA
jgi:hypothetical protein